MTAAHLGAPQARHLRLGHLEPLRERVALVAQVVRLVQRRAPRSLRALFAQRERFGEAQPVCCKLHLHSLQRERDGKIDLLYVLLRWAHARSRSSFVSSSRVHWQTSLNRTHSTCSCSTSAIPRNRLHIITVLRSQ